MKKLLLPLLFAAMVVACSPEPQPSQTPQKPLTPVTPGGSGSGTDEGGGGTTTYEFTVTPSSLTFSAEGGSQTISLVTKASWKLSCQESWVSFGHSTGQGNEQITITVQAWEDTQYDRQATLLFEATGDNAKGSLSYKIVQTKKPATPPTPAGLQYLTGYEIPAIDLKDRTKCSATGQETWGSTNWFNYLTNNSKQKVVTHTYSYNGKQYRNWTGLIDQDKKSPLWIAFPMHKEAYPNLGVGRNGSWTYGDSGTPNTDPGIPESWQKSVASSSYSRGHFTASNYRQTTEDANWQTFYWTNQSLQYQNGFNSGVWSSLEQAVVDNAPTGRDSLYVVVGVLFEDPDKIITTNQQTQELAASHFYKCLMKCSFDASGTMTAAKGCAYIYTNENHSGNYSQGLTSIDAIEARSGWDFFTNVPKDLQDAAENKTNAIF